ncbi:MAG: hypothetical protein ACYTFQ_20890 [Planctomycetota bacterium]|jgi:hypothetical protein
MKRKVLTVIVSVVVTLIAVGVVQWYLSPTQKLKRAVTQMELQLKAYNYRQAIAKINSQGQITAPPPVVAPSTADPNQ